MFVPVRSWLPEFRVRVRGVLIRCIHEGHCPNLIRPISIWKIEGSNEGTVFISRNRHQTMSLVLASQHASLVYDGQGQHAELNENRA